MYVHTRERGSSPVFDSVYINKVLLLLFIIINKTAIWIQALEELNNFMIVNDVPNKERQKLLRNLRVRTRNIAVTGYVKICVFLGMDNRSLNIWFHWWATNMRLHQLGNNQNYILCSVFR